MMFDIRSLNVDFDKERAEAKDRHAYSLKVDLENIQNDEDERKQDLILLAYDAYCVYHRDRYGDDGTVAPTFEDWNDFEDSDWRDMWMDVAKAVLKRFHSPYMEVARDDQKSA